MKTIAGACCLILVVSQVAMGEGPAFAKLPYKSRPLVQEGSMFLPDRQAGQPALRLAGLPAYRAKTLGNLLPSPGFKEGLKGWDTWGDVTLAEVEGEPCLRFGAKKGEESSRIRVYVPKPKGGVMYRLRFEVRMRPDLELDGKGSDVEFDWEASDLGLHGWLTHGVVGKSPIGPVAIRETRRSEQWLPREFRLFSHPKTESLYIMMGFSAVKGEALTRRWELVEERVEAAEGRVVIETPSGEWGEEPHEAGPAAPNEPVAWAPKDADHLPLNARPGPEDRGRPLELAGTPGEMCVGAIGLYTPQAVQNVTLAFGKLTSSGGELKGSPAWKWIVYHPRRTDYYGRGMTFRYVPDFFVERPQGVACPAGGTTAFWVNLRLPKHASPGVYEGQVLVRGQGVDLAVPARVTVYAFALAGLEGKTRNLYGDANRWKGMSDEQVLAELADIRDHGYESLDLGCRGTFTIADGRVTGYQPTEETTRGVRLALQSGAQGPFIFWTGWLPEYLAKGLKLDAKTVAGRADTWPPVLADLAVQAHKLLKAEIAKIGIRDPILDVVDEPGYWKKGSPERLAWDVKVAHAAGWPVYCTSSYLPSDPIGKGLEYHCYGGGRISTDASHAAVVAKETRAAGQQLWYYCTGAYSGQIGNMVRNRYWAGFFFYRCGADGTASWTFQRPRGNAFDDFLVDDKTGEPRTGQPCITYPDPEHPGQNLDTPQWEGLRQAYYDHRYAETLRQAIEAARKHGDARAEQAERRLSELLSALPWNGDAFLWPEMSNEKLSATRAVIAQGIMKLLQK